MDSHKTLSEPAALGYLLSVLQNLMAKSDPHVIQKYFLLKKVTLGKIVKKPQEQADSQTVKLIGFLSQSALMQINEIFEKFQKCLQQNNIIEFVEFLNESNAMAREKFSISQEVVQGQQYFDRLNKLQQNYLNIFVKFMNLAKLIEIQNRLSGVLDLAKEKQRSLRMQVQQLRGTLPAQSFAETGKVMSEVSQVKSFKSWQIKQRQYIDQINNLIALNNTFNRTNLELQEKALNFSQRHSLFQQEFNRLSVLQQDLIAAFNLNKQPLNVWNLRRQFDLQNAQIEKLKLQLPALQQQVAKLTQKCSQLHKQVQHSQQQQLRFRRKHSQLKVQMQEIQRKRQQFSSILEAVQSACQLAGT